MPAYRRIADALRREVISGQREPGTQLPSTNDLAVQWRTSPYTIHTALTRLVKEGWMERLNGTGTYVTDPGRRFVCAGIFHAGDICSNERPPFIRNVHTALLEKFKQRGKETQVFIDTRPVEDQEQFLPALEKALEDRSIQCLITPTLNLPAARALEKLRLPNAYLGSYRGPHQIISDSSDLFTKSIKRLTEQGCHSIGVILNVEGTSDTGAEYARKFHDAVRASGASTHSEWVRQPDHSLNSSDYDLYGYREFHRVWGMPEKPEGLIVYPDVLVPGVQTAALEIGINVVPPQMKFIFHRNRRLAQICPFPVTWAVSDEDAWAEALIRTVEKQFEGEAIEPTLVPFVLEENVPPAK